MPERKRFFSTDVFPNNNLPLDTPTKHQLYVDVFAALQSALPLDLLVFIGGKTMVVRVFYLHDWLTDGPQTLPFEDQEIRPLRHQEEVIINAEGPSKLSAMS